jgi:hypothetical protein
MRIPLKVINKIIHNIRDKNRILPWRIRKPNVNVAVLRPPPSLTSVREYQEMDEEEEEATQAADSVTLMSLRSSRKNIGTGKTMLVRQNAQVFGRPSQAEAKWDISSSLSSSGSSSNRGLIHQRSVTLDGASCSGLSDITEDTVFHRIKRTDPTLLRRHVVFARPAQAHFGDTFCIEEVEESASDDGDRSSESLQASRYDFRQLQVIDESDPWNLYTLSNTNDEFMSPRQRVFSDSDVVFELQRKHRLSDFDADLSPPSSISNTSKVQLSNKNSSESFEQSQIFGKAANRRSLNTYAPITQNHQNAEQRLRTHSDSFIPEAMTFSSHDRAFWARSSVQLGRQSSLGAEEFRFPFSVEERDDSSDSRWRAFSETFRDPIEESQNVTPRIRTRSLEEGGLSSLNEEFSTSFERHARRLSSTLLNQRHQAQYVKSTSAESLFAAISSSSSSSQNSDRAETGAPDHEETVEPLIDEFSTPSMLTAAHSIVTASRRAQASSTTTTTSVINQEYYWGEENGDHEVLWPSVSSADSLDDLF